MDLDFRTKLVMTSVMSLVLLIGNLQERYFPLVIAISLVPYLLLLIERAYRDFFRGFVWLSLAWLSQWYVMTHQTRGFLDACLLLFTVVILRMAPALTMGRYSLLTTSMSDMVAALKGWHMPDSLIIPISVTFRFFYTAKEDYQQIKESLYLHGFTAKYWLKSPLRMIEYRFVPLLLCLSQTADDVAISAMTRGMVVGEKRSTLSTTRLRLRDYLFLSLMLGIVLLDIWSCYVST